MGTILKTEETEKRFDRRFIHDKDDADPQSQISVKERDLGIPYSPCSRLVKCWVRMLIWNGSGLIRVIQALSPCHCKNSVRWESRANARFFSLPQHDMIEVDSSTRQFRLPLSTACFLALCAPLLWANERCRGHDESWMCLRCFSLSRQNHDDVSTRVSDDVRDTAVSFLGIKKIQITVSAAAQLYLSAAFAAFPT